MKIGELYQTADWKNEKHVPVIECPQEVPADSFFEVRVSLGKEIDHPNTTEHHIRWIRVYFKPDSGKFPYEVGGFDFCAHGEAVDGPNTGPVHTFHGVTFSMKTTAPGTLIATAYCNIHGLWESSQALRLR